MKPSETLPAPARTRPGELPALCLHGSASAADQLLRSPASGAPCVHWRLRIFESLASSMELVHEVIAPEPFQILWRPDPVAPPRPVQLCGERVHIDAQPVLHRPGSPGATAVAEHFGLQGRLRVEELLVQQGDLLEARGLLFDPSAPGGLSAGPYRASELVPQLYEATVRVPVAAARRRPALLPWALGTAAALLGAAGTASALTKLWRPEAPGVRVPEAAKAPAKIGPAQVRRPRWP
jgi:hypothetical protein